MADIMTYGGNIYYKQAEEITARYQGAAVKYIISFPFFARLEKY